MMKSTVTSATRKASEKKRKEFENINEENPGCNVSNTPRVRAQEWDRVMKMTPTK